MGEACSHGDEPFALPTMTCNSPDRIAVFGVVVAVVVDVDRAGLLAFWFELEHPAIKIADTAKIATTLHLTTIPPRTSTKPMASAPRSEISVEPIPRVVRAGRAAARRRA